MIFDRTAERICDVCALQYWGLVTCPECKGFGEPIELMGCGHAITETAGGNPCGKCAAEAKALAEDDGLPLPLYIEAT